MTVYTLFPSYVVINYHSSYGKHKATIPTRAWNALGGTNPQGGYEGWDAGNVDADDMITAFVTEWAAMFPSDVVLDDYVIYDFAADPDASPNPVNGGLLTITGTAGTPVSFKAVMSTITMFDSAYHTMKLISLDCASLGVWERRTLAGATPAEIATVGQLTADENAWASRAGFQPSAVRSITRKLNDELRKQYGMS